MRAASDIKEFYKVSHVPPNWLPYYFLYALGEDHIVVCGKGTIDGNGRIFWYDEYFTGEKDGEHPSDTPIVFPHVLKPKAERPVMMYFALCEDIKITGVTLRNSASYTVWANGCTEVLIDGITIRNMRKGPNTDALDIDCCERVKIIHCDIEAGDDCIAIKSDPNRECVSTMSKDIEVSFCKLSTTTCAIRVGYEGDAPIRDCYFHDLEMVDCFHGIDILSITPVCALKIEHGTCIENLEFKNITMENVGQAFFVWAGDEAPREDYKGCISNIRFRCMRIHSVATSYIGGKSPQAITGLEFDTISMTVNELANIADSENPDTNIPSHWGGHFKCGGIRFQGTRPLVWNEVTVSCDNPQHPDVWIK